MIYQRWRHDGQVYNVVTLMKGRVVTDGPHSWRETPRLQLQWSGVFGREWWRLDFFGRVIVGGAWLRRKKIRDGSRVLTARGGMK